MVPKPANQRKTVNHLGWVMFLVLLSIFIAALTGVGWCFVKGWNSDNTAGEDEVSAYENSEITEVEQEDEPPVAPELKKIDLQPLVDEWAASVGGNRSVLIYDLDRDEVIGSYNVDEDYSTASLYKLFVVYEGYQRVQNGEWDGTAAAGRTGRTILECLDLAIRQSDSECAETLWAMIGHDELDEIIVSDFGITNSDISRLISNPKDIAKMMQIYYKHQDITDETLVARMTDSFLNQPVTEYNWRQGLPSGFKQAKVYNKVGWDWNGSSWNIYHDAAIVEFPEIERNLIVVVMTNQVPYQRITELGSKIETSVYSQVE